jgi:hypothetical protein
MCMKECRCCLKFSRGDNSTYTFTKGGRGSMYLVSTIFLHAHLQVVYYKCVKFHKIPISGLGGVALRRYMDAQTFVVSDWLIFFIPPANKVWGEGI